MDEYTGNQWVTTKASFILRAGTHREGMQPDNKDRSLILYDSIPLPVSVLCGSNDNIPLPGVCPVW